MRLFHVQVVDYVWKNAWGYARIAWKRTGGSRWLKRALSSNEGSEVGDFRLMEHGFCEHDGKVRG